MNCDINIGREDEKRMAMKVLKVIGMVLLGIGACILFGFIVMWLWNWLMPQIFELGVITYWQAVGLFVLAKIIFGGFSGSSDSDSKGKKGKHKGVLRREIEKEVGKEIDKEFDKKLDKDFDENLKDEDYDKAYEKWWNEAGEKNFKSFINDSEKD